MLVQSFITRVISPLQITAFILFGLPIALVPDRLGFNVKEGKPDLFTDRGYPFHLNKRKYKSWVFSCLSSAHIDKEELSSSAASSSGVFPYEVMTSAPGPV